MSEKKEPTTSEWIEVKSSKIHRHGIFAAKDIPKDTRIIQYVGNVIPKKTAGEIVDETVEKYSKDREGEGGVYIFELNRDYDIDGNVKWNTAKNINHSCNENCEGDIKNNEIWIKALKDIKKGEELGYDYGYAFDSDYKDHPCLCGSGKCAGYIIAKEQRIKLRKKLVRWKRFG